jgi:hypothetical protein
VPALSTKSIADKLHIKSGKTFLLFNAPPQYEKQLGKLPPGVTMLKAASSDIDIIQLFVHSEAELKQHLPKLKKCLKEDGALWVTYHKGTSKTKTDINRDTIAGYAKSLGLEGVAIISVDDDWSALRLKVE